MFVVKLDFKQEVPKFASDDKWVSVFDISYAIQDCVAVIVIVFIQGFEIVPLDL